MLKLPMRGDLPTIPIVGMGATKCVGSDRYAYTIQYVSDDVIYVPCYEDHPKTGIRTLVYVAMPKYILVTEDEWKVINGSCENGSAVFEFTPVPLSNYCKGEEYVYNKSTKRYRKTTGNHRTNMKMQSISVGFKRKYYDPSF